MKMRVGFVVMMLLVGVTTGCGGGDEAATTVAPTTTAATTPTPSTTTTSTTTTTTTTTTTVPDVATITGRVLFYDPDAEPVSTRVILVVGEDGDKVEDIPTGADGSFTFHVDQAGDYSLQASVFFVWLGCNNLRLVTGPDEFSRMWLPTIHTILGSTGPRDKLIPSITRTLEIDTDGAVWAEMDTPPREAQNEWVIDLELACVMP